MVLPPPMQSSLPAGWLAFTGRELNPLDRYKRFQIIHPPFLDLAWRKRSFIAVPLEGWRQGGSVRQPRRAHSAESEQNCSLWTGGGYAADLGIDTLRRCS